MGKKQPSTKEFNTLLKKYVEKKDFVKIKRTVTDGSANIAGFIIQLSKDFLLLQQEEDFCLNGYAIIRRDHFDAIRCNKFDKTIKKILKAEGITDADYGIQKKIRLKDWQTIFEDLKKHDYHVIVECEDLADPLFLIGPIQKINKSSVNIQYYDATGLFDQRPTRVKYEDITIVKFGDRYSCIFRKYLRKS